MIATDLIMVLSLLAFLLIWWMPGLNHRSVVLTVSAVIALLSGIFGFLDHRWQDAVGGIVAVILLIALLVGRIRGSKANRDNANTGKPWISGVLVALLVLLSIAPLYMFPVTDFPPPSGTFPVGTRSFELSDASRPGVFAAEHDAPRRLLVRAWYPANDIDGLEPRPYFTELEARTTGTRLGQLIFGVPFLFQYIKHSMTNSYPDAPLLKNAKELPVVMYSHGYTAHAGQNTALMEELASHGYVVYSIQHTYDASATVFPNGDIIAIDPALSEPPKEQPQLSDAVKKAFVGSTFDERYTGQIRAKQESIENRERISTQSVQVWLDDRLFVLDSLQQGAVPESVGDLVAASNFNRTGEMGMSFGGSTTGGVCMVDRRCAAAVNLDGGGFHSTPVGKNMPVPFMMLYSDFKHIIQYAGGDENTVARGFNDFSYERHELTGLREDLYRLMVKEVKHLGVTDLPLIARNPASGLLFGAIDGEAMIQIQNEFVRAFFDTYLLGRDVGFPQVQYAKYRQWVEPTDISDVRDWWLAAHPEDVTQQVVLETELGDIELALYPQRAPLAAKQFLDYVSNGHYDGASFYRATDRNRGDGISVIQGGSLARAMTKGDMTEGEEAYSNAQLPLPPIQHETTEQTGITNERGTLAYARLTPGTANSEFFINIEDNPALDTGNTSRNPDGQGYTTFGRVLRGMRVLEQIQSLPTDASTPIDVVKGQILREPVTILRAYKR